MILVYLVSYITPIDIWHKWRTFSYKADVKRLFLFSCFGNLPSFLYSKPFTTMPTSGETRTSSTFQEERLDLTHKRLSYRPTGKHPSPRSVSVWSTTNRSGTSSSTSRPTPCTHWSLTGNTVPPHSAVKNGSRWLVQRAPCRQTVIHKASMLWALIMAILKQESVSLPIRKMIATAVTPELGLVQEGILITPTRVVTRQSTHQIMETKTSQPLDSSWCSEKNGLLAFKAKHRLLFS